MFELNKAVRRKARVGRTLRPSSWRCRELHRDRYTSSGRARLRPRRELWFWVEQRFQRCVKGLTSKVASAAEVRDSTFSATPFSRAIKAPKIEPRRFCETWESGPRPRHPTPFLAIRRVADWSRGPKAGRRAAFGPCYRRDGSTRSRVTRRPPQGGSRTRFFPTLKVRPSAENPAHAKLGRGTQGQETERLRLRQASPRIASANDFRYLLIPASAHVDIHNLRFSRGFLSVRPARADSRRHRLHRRLMPLQRHRRLRGVKRWLGGVSYSHTRGCRWRRHRVRVVPIRVDFLLRIRREQHSCNHRASQHCNVCQNSTWADIS